MEAAARWAVAHLQVGLAMEAPIRSKRAPLLQCLRIVLANVELGLHVPFVLPLGHLLKGREKVLMHPSGLGQVSATLVSMAYQEAALSHLSQPAHVNRVLLVLDKGIKDDGAGQREETERVSTVCVATRAGRARAWQARSTSPVHRSCVSSTTFSRSPSSSPDLALVPRA